MGMVDIVGSLDESPIKMVSATGPPEKTLMEVVHAANPPEETLMEVVDAASPPEEALMETMDVSRGSLPMPPSTSPLWLMHSTDSMLENLKVVVDLLRGFLLPADRQLRVKQDT